MNEPSPRTSRLAIAGALAALIVIGGTGFLLGRGTSSTPPAPPAPAATPALARTANAAQPLRTLARSDLIALGAAAADATSSGSPLPESLKEAAGARFQLYLPFGCDGAAAPDSDAALRWTFDGAASTLRVHVAPTRWPVDDWWQTPPAGLEAIEGFWIARPWSSRETCGGGGAVETPAGTEPITLPGQTLGIVQLVSKDTPRQVTRGGKPYESTVRIAPDALRIDQGLRVRLTGRIARFPEGDALRCAQPGGREQRPVCLIAATFEEVAIENPANGETIATWSPTAGNPPHPAP